MSPIYIGTQSNMSLGGPPPVIGGSEPEPPPGAAAPGVTPAPGAPAAPAAPVAAAGTRPPITPVLPTGSTQQPVVPPGSSPIPGMTTSPAAAPATPQQPAPAPGAIQVFSPPPDAPPPPAPVPIAPPAAPPAAAAPSTPVAPGAATPPAGTPARITLSPPSEMRVGSGPYTIPISVAGASRLSTLTISVTYNPALVRVRSVQEGTFMRQGGLTPAFSSQIDEKSGRIDIVISRPGDQTGASTAGLLAALLIEPLAAGTGSLSVTGSASVPGGGSAALQFLPAGITVR